MKLLFASGRDYTTRAGFPISTWGIEVRGLGVAVKNPGFLFRVEADRC
jgi:hypothetical protein